jgi:hypothetical protein
LGLNVGIVIQDDPKLFRGVKDGDNQKVTGNNQGDKGERRATGRSVFAGIATIGTAQGKETTVVVGILAASNNGNVEFSFTQVIQIQGRHFGFLAVIVVVVFVVVRTQQVVKVLIVIGHDDGCLAGTAVTRLLLTI